MKSIAIVALAVMISIPSSVFAWGPRGSAVVVRPSFPRTVVHPPFFPRFFVGGGFVHAPFGFYPNRMVTPSRFSFTPGWYGSYYYAPSYYYPPYAYAPAYPYYNYPAYGYAPPPPASDASYDRGYSEGYTRGYEEAQKEINRLLDLDKTLSEEHEKSDDEGKR